MVLETLRYADEMEKAQGYFREIPDDEPEGELLELAEALIDRKSGPFHPQEYYDRYVDALRDLIERKRKARGKKIVEDDGHSETAKGGNVVDLMAALRQSMGGKAAPSSAKAPAATDSAPKKPAAKKAATGKPTAKHAARKRA